MKRVVVTGMGCLTPLGNNISEFWENIKDGKNGIDYITRFDTTNFKVKIAGELKNFEPAEFMDKKDTKRMDLYSVYALAAATQAVENSKLDLENINKKRFGVIVGSGIGGLCTMESQIIKMHDKGPNRVGPLFIPMAIENMAAGNIAIKFGAKSSCTSVVTACATGANCIGEAFRNIKHGYADIIIAGGSEASITSIGIAGFTSLTALSESDDINRASIPFDAERNGFVMGEGAGIVVLEELEHAKARNATIYAEIVGYGSTCDAYHMTSPTPNGEGATEAMLLAMEEANIKPEEVKYINAHGTSTPPNDVAETMAIKNAFKEHAKDLLISSTKSMIGHLLGAAGAVEAIVCINALLDSFAPPTIGLKVKDPECDLNYVENNGVKKEMRYALSNSLGFGGHNAVLCIKKWED